MKKWVLLASILLLAVVITACGGSNKDSSNKAEEKEITVSEDEIVSGELVITASNWKFDKEYYAIRAGEPITLTLNSIDGVHGLEIDKTNYSNILDDKPTEISINEPGTYTIRCSIPCGKGHRDMIAKLVVV